LEAASSNQLPQGACEDLQLINASTPFIEEAHLFVPIARINGVRST